EADGQASGGQDFSNDEWIFTIREKDLKKLQNGANMEEQQDTPQRSLSQILSTVITPVFTELKERGGENAVKADVLDELEEAMLLAEETYPGISDVMVTQLIQRLQRFSRARTSSSSPQ
ncbi:serine/threonine-protein kinase 24, partial [Tachysurus ichikawai]